MADLTASVMAMRRGPTGLNGTWKAQAAGNALAQRRSWDKAVHLYRGDTLPVDSNLAVVHEPLGGSGTILTLSQDFRIIGLPYGKIEQNIVITGSCFVELVDLKISGSITIQNNARVSIRNCEISYPGASPAITIQTAGNLVQGCYSPVSFLSAQQFILLAAGGDYNRICANDSRSYALGIVDTGVGNSVTGNV